MPSDILETFRSIVHLRPFARVIELGANDGYHTCRMAEILTEECQNNWTLTAFEPDHRVFPRLQNDTGKWPQVRAILAAVGDVEGYEKMWYSGGEEHRPGFPSQKFSGSSSIMPPAGVRDKYPDMAFSTGDVCVHCLDQYFCGILGSVVDFIWSDIQGAELRMISGGRALLSRTRYLYTEYRADRRPQYEGDVALPTILANLPGWGLVEDFGNDALLRNRGL